MVCKVLSRGPAARGSRAGMKNRPVPVRQKIVSCRLSRWQPPAVAAFSTVAALASMAVPQTHRLLSSGAPVPDEPRNSLRPSGKVTSRPFALFDPSLA